MKKQYFAPEVEQIKVSTGCLMEGSDPFGFPGLEPGAPARARRTLIVP